MDLTLSEDQHAIVDLATQIVADRTAPDQLRDREREGLGNDRDLWAALSAADLIGLSLPESAGGGGYGLLEAALVAEVVGAHVAPVPYVDAIAAARALASAGDDRAAATASGQIVVPALREGPDAAEVARPAVTATATADGWRLQGEKRLVVGADVASALLVSAGVDRDVGLFVVEASAITDRVDSRSTTGQMLSSIRFGDGPARRVDRGDGVDLLAGLRHDLRILRCAQLAGVAAGALALAAEHCKQREQFGAPIGTFQAVAHRMADAWLDTNLVQTTYRQAAWRTDNDRPATQAAASAALWACEGTQRVVHAAQHVHGGIGVDLDFPVHRYFRWAKDIELQLGGASASARDLGAAIAAEPLTIG